MLERLAAVLNEIPGLQSTENVPLSQLTRFAIGGPARILADASSEAALIGALDAAAEATWSRTIADFQASSCATRQSTLKSTDPW